MNNVLIDKLESIVKENKQLNAQISQLKKENAQLHSRIKELEKAKSESEKESQLCIMAERRRIKMLLEKLKQKLSEKDQQTFEEFSEITTTSIPSPSARNVISVLDDENTDSDEISEISTTTRDNKDPDSDDDEQKKLKSQSSRKLGGLKNVLNGNLQNSMKKTILEQIQTGIRIAVCNLNFY